MNLNLHQYHRIILNTSGGKDSQAMICEVLRQVHLVGYPLEHVFAFHADLGRMEWPGTKEIVARQCAHYCVPVIVGRYRNRESQELTLLDYVRKRGKWPSSTTRYCTSEFKRGPGNRFITQVHRSCKQNYVKILNVFGFRAEESPARAKRKPLAENLRASNSLRTVHDWLPIHDWKEDRVWETIRDSHAPIHPAYNLGMPRVSCVFCVFAPRAALMIAGQANPELLAEYVATEKEIGHDFQHGKPIRLIQEALAAGQSPDLEQLHGAWNM